LQCLLVVRRAKPSFRSLPRRANAFRALSQRGTAPQDSPTKPTHRSSESRARVASRRQRNRSIRNALRIDAGREGSEIFTRQAEERVRIGNFESEVARLRAN
jgi:hypothetical protein